MGKREPLAEIYQLKKEGLAELERLAEAGGLELLYGDASRISEHPVVPYGWQFAAEEVFMPAAAQGASVNLFGFISRANRLVFEMTAERITARFVIGMVEKVLEQLRPPTVIVLDNASAHRAAAVRERLPGWAERGLFVFYLPVYSRHLNIAETLWRKLKYEWLEPADYFVWEQLKYWTRLLLSAVGSELKINYSAFSC